MRQSTITTVHRGLAILLAILLGVEALTGILLSMWYEPSRAPATMPSGIPATVITGERMEPRGVFTDTLGQPGRRTLAPARSTDPITSAAAASTMVAIPSAPGGSIVRSIHHHVAPVLVITAVLLLITTFLTTATVVTTTTAIASVVILALLAWSGRILPDDVYAEISRRIVAHELQDAPFGAFLTVLLGIDAVQPVLNRTFAMHMVLGMAMAAWCVRPLRTVGADRRITLGAAAVGVALLIVAAISPQPASILRDALVGLPGNVHVDVWWLFAPFHVLVAWVGGELAGYLVLGVLGFLLWRGRVRGGNAGNP
jgi:hypothetical protein